MAFDYNHKDTHTQPLRVHHIFNQSKFGANSYPYTMLLDSSSGAEYVTLQKYFLHPSLVIYFFATPPIKLKLRLQIGGSTNSKLSGPIIIVNQ
jgi:hypothetical protein